MYTHISRVRPHVQRPARTSARNSSSKRITSVSLLVGRTIRGPGKHELFRYRSETALAFPHSPRKYSSPARLHFSVFFFFHLSLSEERPLLTQKPRIIDKNRTKSSAHLRFI